jgi:hypothetical protein
VEIGEVQLPLLVEPLEDPVPLAVTEDENSQDHEVVGAVPMSAE